MAEQTSSLQSTFLKLAKTYKYHKSLQVLLELPDVPISEIPLLNPRKKNKSKSQNNEESEGTEEQKSSEDSVSSLLNPTPDSISSLSNPTPDSISSLSNPIPDSISNLSNTAPDAIPVAQPSQEEETTTSDPNEDSASFELDLNEPGTSDGLDQAEQPHHAQQPTSGTEGSNRILPESPPLHQHSDYSTNSKKREDLSGSKSNSSGSHSETQVDGDGIVQTDLTTEKEIGNDQQIEGIDDEIGGNDQQIEGIDEEIGGNSQQIDEEEKGIEKDQQVERKDEEVGREKQIEEKNEVEIIERTQRIETNEVENEDEELAQEEVPKQIQAPRKSKTKDSTRLIETQLSEAEEGEEEELSEEEPPGEDLGCEDSSESEGGDEYDVNDSFLELDQEYERSRAKRMKKKQKRSKSSAENEAEMSFQIEEDQEDEELLTRQSLTRASLKYTRKSLGPQSPYAEELNLLATPVVSFRRLRKVEMDEQLQEEFDLDEELDRIEKSQPVGRNGRSEGNRKKSVGLKAKVVVDLSEEKDEDEKVEERNDEMENEKDVDGIVEQESDEESVGDEELSKEKNVGGNDEQESDEESVGDEELSKEKNAARCVDQEIERNDEEFDQDNRNEEENEGISGEDQNANEDTVAQDEGEEVDVEFVENYELQKTMQQLEAVGFFNDAKDSKQSHNQIHLSNQIKSNQPQIQDQTEDTQIEEDSFEVKLEENVGDQSQELEQKNEVKEDDIQENEMKEDNMEENAIQEDEMKEDDIQENAIQEDEVKEDDIEANPIQEDSNQMKEFDIEAIQEADDSNEESEVGQLENFEQRKGSSQAMKDCSTTPETLQLQVCNTCNRQIPAANFCVHSLTCSRLHIPVKREPNTIPASSNNSISNISSSNISFSNVSSSNICSSNISFSKQPKELKIQPDLLSRHEDESIQSFDELAQSQEGSEESGTQEALFFDLTLMESALEEIEDHTPAKPKRIKQDDHATDQFQAEDEEEVIDIVNTPIRPPNQKRSEEASRTDSKENSMLLSNQKTTPRPHSGTKKSGFEARRDELATIYFTKFNATVFGGQLPITIPILWSKTLSKTAGITKCILKQNVRSVEISLAIKVVDSEDRLRKTLAHEMCHAADWILSRCHKPSHGPSFKFWAEKVQEVYPDLQVTRCHSYEINYKFVYKCTSELCGQEYGRHSKSIDVSTKACGKCKSTLRLLEKK